MSLSFFSNFCTVLASFQIVKCSAQVIAVIEKTFRQIELFFYAAIQAKVFKTLNHRIFDPRAASRFVW